LKKGGARPAGTKNLLSVWHPWVAPDRHNAANAQAKKFFASFFQKRSPSFLPKETP
jgi:hypothetical protein